MEEVLAARGQGPHAPLVEQAVARHVAQPLPRGAPEQQVASTVLVLATEVTQGEMLVMNVDWIIPSIRHCFLDSYSSK